MKFNARNRALTLFKALANANRIAIVEAIAAAENQQLSVSNISTAVGLSQPKVSDHLKILRLQKIVAAKQQGSLMVYAIKDPAVVQLLRVAA